MVASLANNDDLCHFDYRKNANAYSNLSFSIAKIIICDAVLQSELISTLLPSNVTAADKICFKNVYIPLNET